MSWNMIPDIFPYLSIGQRLSRSLQMSGHREAKKAHLMGQRTGRDRGGRALALRESVCPSQALAFSRGGQWLEEEQSLLFIILINYRR